MHKSLVHKIKKYTCHYIERYTTYTNKTYSRKRFSPSSKSGIVSTLKMLFCNFNTDNRKMLVILSLYNVIVVSVIILNLVILVYIHTFVCHIN